jgi:hypothetical protein
MRTRGKFLFPWQRLAQSGAALLLMAGLAVLPLSAQQYPQNSSDTGSAQNANNGAEPLPPNQSGMQVPQTFTLPAGTLITVRTSQELSSAQNHPGDSFSGDLTQPLVVGGWVVARRGQIVLGRVESVEKGGVGKKSKLTVQLTRLVLVDGRQFSILTQQIESTVPTSRGEDVAAVGTTTAIGAAIGGAAGGGEGAGIGAAIGATAGIAGVLVAHGRPTVMPPETLLTFQMQQPLAFSTAGSEQAYQPVTQDDYNGQPQLEQRVNQGAPPPPPPPPPYYYPAYPPWGYYAYPPAVFIGYYGYGGYRCGRCGYGHRGYWRGGYGGGGYGHRGHH